MSRVLFGIVALFAVAAAWQLTVGGLDSAPTSETFRYKLTINVTVDGTPYSASSVIEATQRRQTAWSSVSGSGASGGLYPEFTVRGVAPMIRLPDGAVIFASLSGYTDPDVGGVPAGRLPWLIYVDKWWDGINVFAYTNLPIVPLPSETPHVEIPFVGHPKSDRQPPMWYVPPQQLGPAMGSPVSNHNVKQVSDRSILLQSFEISRSEDNVLSCLPNPPAWVAAYRGGPSLGAQELERRRYDRNRPFDRQLPVAKFDTCEQRI